MINSAKAEALISQKYAAPSPKSEVKKQAAPIVAVAINA